MPLNELIRPQQRARAGAKLPALRIAPSGEVPNHGDRGHPLSARNASAIAIQEIDGIAKLAVNPRITSGADTVWLPGNQAIGLTRAARAIAGPDPDAPRLASALHQAAAQQKIALTEHDTAMRRAALAVNEHEATFGAMRKEGRLKSFNAAYAQYRQAAADRGEGFVSYGIALQRLKLALAPQLAEGKTFAQLRVDFTELFQERPHRTSSTPRRRDDGW
jgi:hypothetical protein